MLFFFQNVKDLQAYSIRDSENPAAHPEKEFSGVPSPPWALTFTHNDIYSLRWLDWIFLGGYLSSLSLNYVGMSKDMEKRLPQLYYIKMKISYDLGFIAIGVAMAT